MFCYMIYLCDTLTYNNITYGVMSVMLDNPIIFLGLKFIVKSDNIDGNDLHYHFRSLCAAQDALLLIEICQDIFLCFLRVIRYLLCHLRLYCLRVIRYLLFHLRLYFLRVIRCILCHIGISFIIQ